MNNLLTIKIPYELARHAVWQRKLVTKYETNSIIKALDTWLVLKSITRSSLVQRWNFQKQYLFTICKCSESIFRSRLKLLASMNLVQFDRHNIRVCSWEQLGSTFDIDTKGKFSIQYDYTTSQRVQEWIIAADIKGNQISQANAIAQKLNKNPDYLQAVYGAIIKAGAEHKRLNDLNYVLSWLMIVYRQDFIRASEIHDVLIEVRPDTNRGVRGIAAAWNAKSPSTVSYWKRKMERAGIAYISKLIVESQERVRNRACNVIWLQGKKQTALCMVDSIEILQPWNRLKMALSDKAQKEAA